jgi:type I restriction enzyme M protein
MLTREHLESQLWGAADILRGSIDSSDYKNYIFGFLFLKRLSDVFEEEAESILKDTHDKELAYNEPDEHRFFVPPAARWTEIMKLASGIGEGLNKASAALEDANTALEGILLGIDFNDERRLGDQKQIDDILGQLIQHFAKLNLRNDNLSEPDMLGRAYEYLIEKFADDAGKKGGEFYTPRKVVELIVKLLHPVEGMRICDPTCGSGGMLVESTHEVERSGGNPRNLTLFGQEKNLSTWAICRMNMMLHNIPDARIEKGDTIRDPKLLEHGELMLFDLVVANPPFSLDKWGIETAMADQYNRFDYGLPPKSKGDLAFVQHMIRTLNSTGRAGVVVPHGVLFRGGSEATIREKLLKDDLLEAVVGLPVNLFYGTGIPAAILIFNRAKNATRAGKVLFIDASNDFRAGKNQNTLRDEDISKIVSTYKDFAEQGKYSAVVPMNAIAENDFNLNLSRYVVTTDAPAVVTRAMIEEEIKKLRELEKKRNAAELEMNTVLRELGFEL